MTLKTIHAAVCRQCHKAFLAWEKLEKLPAHPFYSEGQTCSGSGQTVTNQQTFLMTLDVDPRSLKLEAIR